MSDVAAAKPARNERRERVNWRMFGTLAQPSKTRATRYSSWCVGVTR
jgi:hypothetical protein